MLASTKKLMYNLYTTIGHGIHACSRGAMMSEDLRCPHRGSTEERHVMELSTCAQIAII